MRVLFTVTNWRGLYFSMIPLGWALQAAGHEVRVVCPQAQSSSINEAGLIPAPVLRDVDWMRAERMARYAEVARSPELFSEDVPLLHPETGKRVQDLDEYDIATHEPAFRRACEKEIRYNYEAAVNFARDWRPSLVLHDLMAPEGVLAAQVTGVPSVFHSPGLFGAAEASLSDPVGAFAKNGIELDRSLIKYVIDPTPSVVTPDHGIALPLLVRYVPYNGPGEMPLWLLERPALPRVCLLWSRGTSNIFGTGLRALQHVIDAVTALGAELMLVAPTEQIETLNGLPDNVRQHGDFPLRMVLPTCSAIIHQGSANPIMAGAAAGLPQLSLGLTDDGLEIGRRFSQGGSGLSLPGLTASHDEIHEAVASLLGDDRLRAAAQRIQADINDRATPAGLLASLEELAQQGDLTARLTTAPTQL